MDHRSFRQLMEEVRCPLCLEFLRSPRVLSCQHSFCTECLEALYKSLCGSTRNIPCPVCRHVTTITNSGDDNPIESLTINLPLQNIVNSLAEHYQSRSPSPENQQQIVPAFPPPACGVDYSFFALPRRTPSPCTLSPAQNTAQHDNCIAASVDFPFCKVDESLSKWAEKLWFAPSDLLKQMGAQKPFDVYLEYIPFYILDFEVTSSCTATIPSSHRDNIRGRTVENSLEKKAKHTYSHLVCAAKDEKIFTLIQDIHDWNPYAAIPNCTIVTSRDLYKWPAVWNLREVEKTIFKQEEVKMRQEINQDISIQSLNLSVKYSDIYHTLVYLPVYITNYKYNSQSYTALVSGQTGTVSAGRPFGLGTAGAVVNKIRGWFIPSNN